MFRRLLLGTALALPVASAPALAQEGALDNNGHDATNLTKQVQEAQERDALKDAQQQAAAGQAADGDAAEDGIVFPPSPELRNLAPGEIRDQKGLETSQPEIPTADPREETASLSTGLSDAEAYKERAEQAIRAWDDTIQNPPEGMDDANFAKVNEAWAEAQRSWTEMETAVIDEGRPPQNWETLKQRFEQSLRELGDQWRQSKG